MARSNARSSLSVSTRRQHRYFLGSLAINAMLLAAGLVGLRLAASNPAWWLADVVFLAFAFVQVALLGHDIAHLQFVRAGRLNSALGLVLGNLLVGVQPGVVGRQPQRAPCSTK